uniref:Predicted protein n=1 Tax=Physcomitrium patens TaxID=3218 RepID=A9U530_PHYPA
MTRKCNPWLGDLIQTTHRSPHWRCHHRRIISTLGHLLPIKCSLTRVHPKPQLESPNDNGLHQCPHETVTKPPPTDTPSSQLVLEMQCNALRFPMHPSSVPTVRATPDAMIQTDAQLPIRGYNHLTSPSVTNQKLRPTLTLTLTLSASSPNLQHRCPSSNRRSDPSHSHPHHHPLTNSFPNTNTPTIHYSCRSTRARRLKATGLCDWRNSVGAVGPHSSESSAQQANHLCNRSSQTSLERRGGKRERERERGNKAAPLATALTDWYLERTRPGKETKRERVNNRL